MKKINSLNSKMNTYGLKLINLSQVSEASKVVADIPGYKLAVCYSEEHDFVTAIALSPETFEVMQEVYRRDTDFVCFIDVEVPSSYIATRVALKLQQLDPGRTFPTILINEVMWNFMDTEWCKAGYANTLFS